MLSGHRDGALTILRLVVASSARCKHSSMSDKNLCTMGICAVCKEPVAGPVVPVITGEDGDTAYMHPECFTCKKCARFIPSDDSSFQLKNNEPLCHTCNGSGTQKDLTTASTNGSGSEAKISRIPSSPLRDSPGIRRVSRNRSYFLLRESAVSLMSPSMQRG